MNFVNSVRPMLPGSVERWLRARMWRYLWPRWTLRSGISLEITGPADWEVFSEIFVDGEYDPAIDAALLEAPADRPIVVLDLGANLGFFSLRVLDRMHALGASDRPVRLILVEGSMQMLRQVTSRSAYAALERSGARIVHGLAGKRSGVERMYESDDHLNNSIMPSKGRAGTEVSYVDLENLCADVPQIDLVKCDIQGSEEVLLESQPELFAKTRRAVLELHHLVCDTNRCRALLEKAGFSKQVVLHNNKFVDVIHCWK